MISCVAKPKCGCLVRPGFPCDGSSCVIEDELKVLNLQPKPYRVYILKIESNDFKFIIDSLHKYLINFLSINYESYFMLFAREDNEDLASLALHHIADCGFIFNTHHDKNYVTFAYPYDCDTVLYSLIDCTNTKNRISWVEMQLEDHQFINIDNY